VPGVLLRLNPAWCWPRHPLNNGGHARGVPRCRPNQRFYLDSTSPPAPGYPFLPTHCKPP
jgi:hypothetical protein